MMQKHLLLLAGLAALFLVSCQTTDPKGGALSERVAAPPNEFRGAWVYDPRGYEPEDVVRDLKEAGFNAELTSAGHRRLQQARPTHLAGVHSRFLDHFDDTELHAFAGFWERVLPGATAE